MSDEKLIETLRLFEEKRVEQLPESARQLFYAIMKIADERDRLKKIINEIKEIIEWAYEESEYLGALYSIEKAIKSDKELKEGNNGSI